MSLSSLPVELVHKVLDHLPLENLVQLSEFDTIALDLSYRDVRLCESGNSFNHNVFCSLDEIQRFIDEHPNFTPFHLVLESQNDLLPGFDFSQFKYLSIESVTSQIPESFRNFKFKSLSIDNQKTPINPKLVSELQVEKLVLYNGEMSMIPKNVESLILVNTMVSMEFLQLLSYLKLLELYSSISEYFSAHLPSLRHLVINDFAKDGDLMNLKNLNSLEIHNVNKLSNLPNNLKHLKISDGKDLRDIKEIQKIDIETLILDVTYICSHGDFYKNKIPDSVRELHINFCSNYLDLFNEINNMKLPSNLERFEINNCEDLTLSTLQIPQTLKHFSASNILGFEDFTFNDSLESLNLENVLEMEDLVIPESTSVTVYNEF